MAEAVRSRLDELREKVSETVTVTQTTVIRDLEALKHQAVDLDKPGEAIRATELQGRAIGMFRDSGPEGLRRAGDDDILLVASGGNPEVEAALRAWLASGQAGRAAGSQAGSVAIEAPDESK